MLLIFFLTFSLTSPYNIDDYCNSKCKDDTLNVVCQRKSSQCNFAINCQNISVAGLRNIERQLVEDVHNELREKVANGMESRGGGMPPASNMFVVSYDLELEFSAQCNVNSCHIQQETCPSTPKYKSFGENAAYFTGNKLNIRKLITSWYDEIRDHVRKQYYGLKPNNFSLLINAKTSRVGCGKIYFGRKRHYFVCYYYPGRNGDKRMYVAGPRRSRCPAGVINDKFQSLCGKIEKTSGFISPFFKGNESSEDVWGLSALILDKEGPGDSNVHGRRDGSGKEIPFNTVNNSDVVDGTRNLFCAVVFMLGFYVKFFT